MIKTAVSVFLLLAISSVAFGQRTDHLTKEEIELIRDVQAVDLRMIIFNKAIDRRIYAITGTDQLPAKQQKKIAKDDEKFGKLKTVAKSLLLRDIALILNESIDKFEDVYDRDPKNELIPYAYFNLADFCEKLIPRLRTLVSENSTADERNAVARAVHHCEEILKVKSALKRPTKKRPQTKRPIETLVVRIKINGAGIPGRTSQ